MEKRQRVRRSSKPRRSEDRRHVTISNALLATGVIVLALLLWRVLADEGHVGHVANNTRDLVVRVATDESKLHGLTFNAISASKQRTAVVCRSVERVKSTLRDLTAKSEQQTIEFLRVLHLPRTPAVQQALDRETRRTALALAPKSCQHVASLGPGPG